ncbi:MAG: SLC13 family permease [Syntrophobacteraceae bacterium]|nr:SLC13 family permease [Syntrophobacteraceae bacterium]
MERAVNESAGQNGAVVYLARSNIILPRAITPAFRIATAILFCVYTLIAFEHLHRTPSALSGAAPMLAVSYTAGTFNPDYRILDFGEAMHAIDLNVIFLLMAMMIIVGVMKKTGVFQWMAYKSYLMAGGNVFVLASALMLVTAVVSAFLDNVTSTLLIIPVTIEIALTLKISPVSLLIPEAFASNICGTATPIGDPPNIMIGSYVAPYAGKP